MDWRISAVRKAWESWDCWAWRREGSGGILSVYINTWRESAKKTEPGCFQWCPVTGEEAVGTNWNMRGFVLTSGNIFLLWGWPRTGTGCPERLWSLRPWRYSKTIWTQSWPISSRWPCLSRGVEPDDFQKSLPVSVILLARYHILIATMMYQGALNFLSLQWPKSHSKRHFRDF